MHSHLHKIIMAIISTKGIKPKLTKKQISLELVHLQKQRDKLFCSLKKTKIAWDFNCEEDNAESGQFYTGTPQDDAKPESFEQAFKEQDWSQFICDRNRFIQSMTEKIRLQAKLVRSLLWSLDIRKRRSEDLFQRRGFQNRQWDTTVRNTSILLAAQAGNRGSEEIVKKWEQGEIFHFWMAVHKSKDLFRREDSK